ncbi:MiaB-like protein [uncultured Desulfobacterium sp.]|uniref:MiaB-like protein n=1 Tax=uncultured Desulfobacterium sp. TaxID=201089 RepID=A0A445MX92_9BACT|nr:MiaB-like protein [uncultured Desulfobacterium sp.]
MPKSFKIITLGCKVNQYESAYLSESLEHAGLIRASEGEGADIHIINTCIVTRTASHQSRQEIRKAIREKPDAVVIATGCYAQVYPEELLGIDGISLIVGNTDKAKITELVLQGLRPGQGVIISKDFKKNAKFEFLPIRRFPDRARAFLKIQDGCQCYCSYCIVPLARGPYRSLPREDVLNMLERLAGQGYREVVLTGIHLGMYGVDLKNGTDLGRLLVTVRNERLPLRIRLSSLEINEINEGLLEMMASEGFLCKHLHIPLQSGDDRILKRMNRHYTTRQFAQTIRMVHDKAPLAAIGIDIMAGFPGEDISSHGNTCALIDDLPISYLHVFPFSPRPGTAAFLLGERVDPQSIKKRAAELRDLGQKKKMAFFQRCLNKDFPVLAERWHSEKEGIIRGTSDNYLPVLFPLTEKSNWFIPVRMEGVENNLLLGRAVSKGVKKLVLLT